ncbi:MAG TPA: leucine-rich repeat domain-containing protein [Candidatus Limnocylindria bacterium]|nr:leucine-rich repeat domain-containing protein [Candidatus Limnocylindria bacterium]
MVEVIQQWILKFKRAGRVDRAFLVAGVLLSIPTFLKKQLTDLFPSISAKLAPYGWLDQYLQGVCLAAVSSLLVYGVWKIWLRTPPTPKEVIIDPGPLKGGSSYGPQDGELFLRLGRRDELGQLWGWVLDSNVPFIAIKAESGAGKTSLLRAGLQYLLTQKYDALAPKQLAAIPTVYCEMRPSDPVGDLLALIRGEWKTVGIAASPPTTLQELLQYSSDFPRRLVLMLDQFEQLREEDSRHAPVFEFLSGLAARRGPCHLTCVVAFREEYASAWMNFCVQRLDAKNLLRPRELILNLFRRDDRPERNSDAVLVTLAEQAKLEIDDARKPLLEALTDLKGRISPFDLSVSLLCLSQLGRSHIGVRDIPANGLQGLFAQYLEGLLEHVQEEERALVFGAIYFGLIEHDADRSGDGPRRIAEGRALGELAKGRLLDSRRLEYALNTLSQREAGLLERLPDVGGGPRYRLLHERFVQAIRMLSGVHLAEADKARAKLRIAYQSYILTRRWSHLLTGVDLQLVHVHWADLPHGEDARELEDFYRRSLSRRTASRIIGTSVMTMVLCVAYWGIQQARDNYWYEKLAKWRLPRDLYNVQGQLTKLHVQNRQMEDARWINVMLTDLEFHCPNLRWFPKFSRALTNLSLADCNITDAEVCSRLPALASLDLGGNKLTTLAGLEKLPALTSLDLGGNKLTTLAGLEKLPALTSLHLGGNKLTTLAGLEKLPALTSLDLSGNELTTLAGLEKLPALTSLDLGGNKLTNLAGLEKLPELEYLWLPKNDLNPMNLVGNLPKLVFLDCTGNFLGVGGRGRKGETNGLSGEIQFGIYTDSLKPLPLRIRGLTFSVD